jgi:Lrp/AsnC family leucine-responsive transcriptional regulator
MSKNLDEVDQDILSELLKNARIPVKLLAKKVKYHPNTVLQRLKKLEHTKTICGYTTKVDYVKFGYDLHVMILLKIRKSRPGDTTQLGDLLQTPELESCYAIAGTWDILSIWRIKNREHLNQILTKLSSHPDVAKTSSHMILYTYAEPNEFNPFLNKSTLD